MISLDIYNVLKISLSFIAKGLTRLRAIAMLSIAGIAKRHDVLRTEGKKENT